MRAVTTDELLRRLAAAGIRVPPSGVVRAALASQIVDVHPRTLEEWRAAGKPPHARKLNGAWHYDIAELARFLSGDDE